VGQRLQLQLEQNGSEQTHVPLMVIYRMGKHYGLSILASNHNLLELLPMNS
jgi:hypothetical protein